MLHRYGAYALTLLVVACALRARLASDPAVRGGAAMTLGLTGAQVVLGVCSVLLATPPWIVAAHLATATTLLALLVTTTFRAASLPAPRGARVALEAR
jgi:heme A synthase